MHQNPIVNRDVSALVVDDRSLPLLHEMGLGVLCPHIKELAIEVTKAGSLEVVFGASSSFPHLTNLGLVGLRDYWVTLDQSESFCKRLMTCYPRLTSLTFTDVRLGNKIAVELIGYLRHHQFLTRIE